MQLATTLQGVVTQQLLQTTDGQGRVVACEVLVATPAVRNLIREGKIHQIYSAMQAGGRFGMQTMDMSLAALVKAGQHQPGHGVRAVPRPRGAPTPGRRRRFAPHEHGRRGSRGHGRHDVGRRLCLIPTTTRSETSRGTSSPASWSRTTSAWSSNASARWATSRSRSQGEEGPQPRDQHRPAKIKLKDLAIFSRQFATMVNSGLPILRALSILAEQTEQQGAREDRSSLVRIDVEQGASLSRPPWRSTRRRSTTCSSRWSSPARRAASSTTCCSAWRTSDRDARSSCARRSSRR